MESLGQHDLDSKEKQVVIINQDSFYCDLTEDQRKEAALGDYNFDHPGQTTLYGHGPTEFYPVGGGQGGSFPKKTSSSPPRVLL